MTRKKLREFGEQVGRFLLHFNRDGSPCDGFRLREECVKTRDMAWALGFLRFAPIRWSKTQGQWVGQVEGKNQFLVARGKASYLLYLPHTIVYYKRLGTAKKAAARYYESNGRCFEPPLLMALMAEGGPS